MIRTGLADGVAHGERRSSDGFPLRIRVQRMNERRSQWYQENTVPTASGSMSSIASARHRRRSVAMSGRRRASSAALCGTGIIPQPPNRTDTDSVAAVVTEQVAVGVAREV